MKRRKHDPQKMHFIKDDKETYCGINYWTQHISATREWKDVKCKTCKARKRSKQIHIVKV